MNNKHTGGPAFPQFVLSSGGAYVEGGATLRDYFAAKAMQAYIQGGMQALSKAYRQDTDAINPIIAKAAYETADAMLEARQA